MNDKEKKEAAKRVNYAMFLEGLRYYVNERKVLTQISLAASVGIRKGYLNSILKERDESKASDDLQERLAEELGMVNAFYLNAMGAAIIDGIDEHELREYELDLIKNEIGGLPPEKTKRDAKRRRTLKKELLGLIKESTGKNFQGIGHFQSASLDLMIGLHGLASLTNEIKSIPGLSKYAGFDAPPDLTTDPKGKASLSDDRRNVKDSGHQNDKLNLPHEQDELTLKKMLVMTMGILESDTVYKSALSSNIRAFHKAVTEEGKVKKMEEKIISMARDLAEIKEILKNKETTGPQKRDEEANS